MVKQKMVIKVSMESAKKRSKALKALSIAVGFCGVISASLDGEDKVVVVGLSSSATELISVGEETKVETAKYCVQPMMLLYHSGVMQPFPYVVHKPTYDPNPCNIL